MRPRQIGGGLMAQHSGRLTIFQAAAVDDPNLGHAAFRVLAALGTYSDERGWCYPKQTTLATRLRISQQAVSKSLKQLATLGYIAIHEQYDGRGMRSASRYRLMLDYFPSQPDVVTSQPRVVKATTPEVVTVTTSEVVSATTPEVVTLTSQRERPKKNDPHEKVSALPRVTTSTYQPDEAIRVWVETEYPDLDYAAVLSNWRDYHLERGTTIKDFVASFRRWVRNERPPSLRSIGGRPASGHRETTDEYNKRIEREVLGDGSSDIPGAIEAAWRSHEQEDERGTAAILVDPVRRPAR